jgi:hypothetical protein
LYLNIKKENFMTPEFKAGDNVRLKTDHSKTFIVDEYYFQEPLIQRYTITNKGNIPEINDGSYTTQVWCIPPDGSSRVKIEQDMLELIPTS